MYIYITCKINRYTHVFVVLLFIELYIKHRIEYVVDIS